MPNFKAIHNKLPQKENLVKENKKPENLVRSFSAPMNATRQVLSNKSNRFTIMIIILYFIIYLFLF